MSARGSQARNRRSAAAAAAAEDSDDAGPSNELDANDPIINSIRYGMDSVMKIVTDTVPYCDSENEKQAKEITGKMESALLKLVEAELVYSQTNSIVNQVVDELGLKDPSPDMDHKDFLENVDKMEDLANKRLAEYKSTLTPDMLRFHPTLLRMKNDVEAMLKKDDDDDVEITDPADAETEAEEVDLEDSTLDDGDAEAREHIPELDPISKQPLRDPVRNKICRHIYGKAAIVELIKKNPRTRCPAMGCGNKQYVRVGDLMDDPALTQRVLGGSGAVAGPSSGPRKTKTANKRRSKRR